MNARTALAWEHSARTLPFVLIGLAAGVVCSFSALQLSRWYFDDIEAAWILHTITISIASLGVLYTISSDDRLICGIPPSALLLPVPARDIVFIRFALGTASMILLSAVFYRMQVWWFFAPTAPWWVYAAVAGGLFALLQLIAIAVTPLGDLSIAVLAAALLSSLWYFGLVDVERTLPRFALAAMVLCPILGLAIVNLQRHGQWSLRIFTRTTREAVARPKTGRSVLLQRLLGKPSFVRIWIGTIAGVYIFQMVRNLVRQYMYHDIFHVDFRFDESLYFLVLANPSFEEFVYTAILTLLVLVAVREIKTCRAAFRSSEPFPSPAEAQRWFEIMRIWPLYLGVVGVGLAYAIGALFYEYEFLTWPSDISDFFPYLPRYLTFTMVLASLLVGCVMTFLNFRLQSGPMRDFLYLRPLPTREIAAARLYAVIRIFAPFTLVALAVIVALTTLKFGFDSYLEDYLAISAAPWAAMWTAISVVVFVVGNMALAIASDVTTQGTSELQVIMCATGLGAVLLAALYFTAQRRRLVIKPLFFIGLALCFLAWLRAVDFFFVRLRDGSWQFKFEWQPHYFEDTVSLAVLTCTVLAPLLTVPLIMHWTRHR